LSVEENFPILFILSIFVLIKKDWNYF